MKFSFKHKLWVALLLALSLFTGCGAQNPANIYTDSEATEAAFNRFSEDFFQMQVTANTLNLHFTLANPENFGITETPISLGDISNEAIHASCAAIENTLCILNDFDYEKLSLRQQLDFDILSDYLNTEYSAANLTLYDEILRPSTGIQAELPVLYEEYRFTDKQDIEDYLSLIALTDCYFEQIIHFEQEKASAGLFMPDYACDTIISQCNRFIENPDEHYLILTFNHKLEQMPDLTAEERKTYQMRNKTLVKEHVLPAYQNLSAALTKLLGSGKNALGLCYFPDGKKYYEYLVYHNTGSAKSLSDIQKMIAKKRAADLSAATALTLGNPNLAAQCNATRLTPTDSIATLHILQDKMNAQFPAAPDTKFTVNYIDACMEDYMAPAFYITAPLDNYEKNSIFINASTDTTTMRYFTTLAHEGFPGHLYQTVMSYKAGLSPMRSTLNFPGYVEGWATYVEMLSYQYAGLEENIATLMALDQSALLSLYASTDLGIHYSGWDFSDMLSFWNDYGITDKKALREIYELIVEEPAHYLKYYVGYLEFLELKEKAQKTYGNDYNDISFHQAILDIGPAPFSILDKYFADYYH